jgi:hypothetical protein
MARTYDDGTGAFGPSAREAARLTVRNRGSHREFCSQFMTLRNPVRSYGGGSEAHYHFALSQARFHDRETHDTHRHRQQ